MGHALNPGFGKIMPMVHSNKMFFSSLVSMWSVVYVTAVQNVRKEHRIPLMSLVNAVMKSLIFVLSFVLMFEILGMRAAAIRGDFIIYLMTGIFMFMTHLAAIGAVSNAPSPASPLMQHGPMTPTVAILGAALGSLYTQILSVFILLAGYYLAFEHFVIYDWIGCLLMFLLAWGSGVAIGIVVYSAQPWAPGFFKLLATFYQRITMLASGKMFVANMMPAFVINMFDWNPLFHIIDQTRGYAFVNYSPRNSGLTVPLLITAACIVIGLITQYYTSKRASASWMAK